MSGRIQNIVNAQISVNRAVHEANKSKPDEDYIDHCISSALSDLSGALWEHLKLLRNRRKRP